MVEPVTPEDWEGKDLNGRLLSHSFTDPDIARRVTACRTLAEDCKALKYASKR